MRETENRSSIEKNQQNQKLVLENISKTDKLLIRLTKKKKKIGHKTLIIEMKEETSL